MRCDIPSLLYSFSFVKNPSWSRAYPPGGRSAATSRTWPTNSACAAHPVQHEVTGCAFDENAGVWTAKRSKRSAFRARTVVLASGPLANPELPDIRGLDSYQGMKIHSARWDHDYDFTGKRVAVIGTGASAVQIVPELVKQAESVKVFQRTPGWVLPRLDFATPTRGTGAVRQSAAHARARPPGAVLGP